MVWWYGVTLIDIPEGHIFHGLTIHSDVFIKAFWTKQIEIKRLKMLKQRFSRVHLARTRPRTRPLVEFFRGQDGARNFSLFLGLFKDETRNSSEISAFFLAILRTRLLILVFRGRGRDEGFCLIPRPFRGQDETLENLCVLETSQRAAVAATQTAHKDNIY